MRRLLIAILLTCAGFFPAQAQFTVSAVEAAADAADAVAAKEAALEQARALALDRLWQRLAPPADRARMPPLDAAQIEALVEGISVRREQTSATRYLATLDIGFSAAGVRRLAAQTGVVLIEARAAPTALLLAAAPETGLTEALARADLKGGMAPLERGPDLAPAAALAVVTSADAADGAARAAGVAGAAIIALAERSENGITLRVAGRDAVGPVVIARSFRGEGAALEAARFLPALLEGRWKLAQGASAAGAGPAAGAALSGPTAPVQATAQFASAGEWRTVRERLLALPGAANLNIVSLTARSARFTIDLPGGPGGLPAAATAAGLTLGADGGLTLSR